MGSVWCFRYLPGPCGCSCHLCGLKENDVHFMYAYIMLSHSQLFYVTHLVIMLSCGWYKVEPNQEFHGLVCEGANVLPAKFLQDAFRNGYGMVIISVSQYILEVPCLRGWYIV